MKKWSRKNNWRNYTTMCRTRCLICYKWGDALGNPPSSVIIVKGIGAMTKKQSRDAFKIHVKKHHEPEWLNARLEWSIKR